MKPARTAKFLPAALAVAASLGVQLWIAARANSGALSSSGYYSRLADGFTHGHLSLEIVPDKRLLALSDPYDPAANSDFRQFDVSLFDGKYYLYWGPVPALILAGLRWPGGGGAPRWNEEYLGAAFMMGATLLFALLVHKIRRRWFADLPPSCEAVPILSLGLGAPVLFCLTQSRVYETAVFAGQFFMLGGLCCAWFAVAEPRRCAGWLTGAGACWALSAGSRISLLPALGVMAALTLQQVWKHSPSHRRMAAATLAVPICVGACLLGWYNLARFGSILETGARYQLSGQRQTAMFSAQFVSLAHIPANLAADLLTAPNSSPAFPYLEAVDAKPWLQRWFKLWPSFGSEPMCGVLWSQIFLVFAFWNPGGKGASEDQRTLRWLPRALFWSGILAMIPSLMVNVVAMRYLLDGLPCWSLLAATGCFGTLQAASECPGALRWLKIAAVLIIAWQCLAAIPLAVSRNPAVFYSFTKWLPLL